MKGLGKGGARGGVSQEKTGKRKVTWEGAEADG